MQGGKIIVRILIMLRKIRKMETDKKNKKKEKEKEKGQSDTSV